MFKWIYVYSLLLALCGSSGWALAPQSFGQLPAEDQAFYQAIKISHSEPETLNDFLTRYASESYGNFTRVPIDSLLKDDYLRAFEAFVFWKLHPLNSFSREDLKEYLSKAIVVLEDYIAKNPKDKRARALWLILFSKQLPLLERYERSSLYDQKRQNVSGAIQPALVWERRLHEYDYWKVSSAIVQIQFSDNEDYFDSPYVDHLRFYLGKPSFQSLRGKLVKQYYLEMSAYHQESDRGLELLLRRFEDALSKPHAHRNQLAGFFLETLHLILMDALSSEHQSSLPKNRPPVVDTGRSMSFPGLNLSMMSASFFGSFRESRESSEKQTSDYQEKFRALNDLPRIFDMLNHGRDLEKNQFYELHRVLKAMGLRSADSEAYVNNIWNKYA